MGCKCQMVVECYSGYTFDLLLGVHLVLDLKFTYVSLLFAAFVEELVRSGRQVDAVNFIHAFELTESFPPVPLLKTHLKDLRRNSQGKPGGGAAGAHVAIFLALVNDSSLLLIITSSSHFFCRMMQMLKNLQHLELLSVV